MEVSMAHLPGWVIVMDYILGLIMWTLIGRVAMNIFLPLHSDFFFMRAFVKYTNPIINLFGPITPKFLPSDWPRAALPALAPARGERSKQE